MLLMYILLIYFHFTECDVTDWCKGCYFEWWFNTNDDYDDDDLARQNPITFSPCIPYDLLSSQA